MSYFRRAGAYVARVLTSVTAPVAQASTVRVFSRTIVGQAYAAAVASDGTDNALQTPPVLITYAKGIYGDGSDGSITYAVNTTLARDVFADQLVVNAGVTLNTAGYRVFAKTSCVNNGTIANDAAGQPAIARGSYGQCNAGGASATGNGADGADALNMPQGYTSAGGAGGSSGARTGGSGGTSSSLYGDFRTPYLAVLGGFFRSRIAAGMLMLEGGPGGGGGAGNGAAVGGAGGAGGGTMLLCCRTITNNGTISARGANGANAVNANTGGGGGGAGGVIVIVAESYTGAAPDVSGGAAGSSTGTATAATAGGAGIVVGPLPG